MEAALSVFIIIVSIVVSAIGMTKKKPVRRSPAPVHKATAAVNIGSEVPLRSTQVSEEEPEESEADEEPEDEFEADESEEESGLPESDLAIPEQENGSSRECEHGSIGGSMDITTHEGGTKFEHAKVQVKAHVRPEYQQEEDTVIGEVRRLDAKDMRRAVIVSEILKRPDERMRERRWR